MKQFILFFILATLSVGSVYAQDSIADEFADPVLQTEKPPSSSENNSANEVQSNELPGSLEIPIEPTESVSPKVSIQPSNNQNFDGSFTETNQNLNGEVILEKQTDYTASYKQRRGRHGILFSIDYEKYYPTDYFSQFRDVYIENMIGTDRINLLNAELGYKLNFQLGSLGILANFAQGKIEGAEAGLVRRLNIQKIGLSANFALDNFFQEPWIVPYGQVGVHQFQVQEFDITPAQTKSESATTQPSFNYKVGLLFQLNWIEKAIDSETQFDGLKSSGLQNTFLDVYMIDHLASSETYDPKDSSSQGDPDMASSFELGVGLKMEF